MMLFAKLEEGIQSLTIYTKISILEDSKYVSLSDQKILKFSMNFCVKTILRFFPSGNKKCVTASFYYLT